MLTYEDGITYDLIDHLAKRQSKMYQDVLEDIGGYLVAEDSQGSIRRLLRFGGATFEDFYCPLMIWRVGFYGSFGRYRSDRVH